MPTPNAAYSIRLRVALEDTPGSFAAVATAIGDAGGQLRAVDMESALDGKVVRAISVDATDDVHAKRIEDAVRSVGVATVLDAKDRTMLLHEGGKIGIHSKIPRLTRDELSMAYTPGVARVCRKIADDPSQVRNLTIKSNMVAIVSDGTAVLGLGDIGPEAAIPVMEGKALLFKEFADVDAFPICVHIDPPAEDGSDPGIEQLVDLVARLEPVFGGVNLEDIAAPRCFEVEARLRERLSIPVFHDDQHGTAVVALAALRNALKVVGKSLAEVKIVMAGAGAAGVAIARILESAGARTLIACDRKGAIHTGREGLDASKQWLAENTNPEKETGSLKDVVGGADVFIGVSGPGLLDRSDVERMAPSPIVFALANPDPEVAPADALGIAAVYATGRSDYPNQINNVLCYPGIFRGALDAGATTVTEGMKLAAADAIASAVPDDQVAAEYIIPSVFNKDVVRLVASAVAKAAVADGVTRSQL